MKSNSNNQPSVVSLIDQGFWFFYLLILIAISFANQASHSFVWLMIYSLVFLNAGLYCGFRCLIKKPLYLLFNTRLAIAILIIMLLWLILQCVVPAVSQLDSHLFGANQAAWFSYSSVWSVTPERTQWAVLVQLTMVVLFVMTLALLDRRRRVKQLLYVLILIGTVHALIAVMTKYLGLFVVNKESLDGHFDAARGLFINRNHLAAFITLCLTPMLAIQLKLLMKNQSSSLNAILFKQVFNISFFLLLLAFITIVLSESRGAFLSFLLSLVIYVGFIKKTPRMSIRKNFILMSVTVLMTSIVLLFGQGIIARFTGDALSLGERITQWEITWQAIKYEWFFGYGAGSYELVFQSFRKFSDLRLVVYDQAHNDFLHILLEQGLLGLMLWLSFICVSLQYAIRSYLISNSTLERSVLLSILIAVSALLIQSLVGYQLQIMTIRCYFFVIMAMIFAVPMINNGYIKR